MKNHLKILQILMVIAVLVQPVGTLAGTFPNKDTAESRKDIVMGVTSGKSSITVDQDDAQGIVLQRPEKQENENQDYGPIFVTPEIKTTE